MSAHVRRINRQDRIATGVLVGIAAFVMLMLAAIVIYILVAGAPKLFDLNFLTGKPQQFKEGGGIGPELFNSFYLLILTLLISVPLSLGAAIFLSQYAPDNAATAVAKTAIETLSSLPSVVVGLFGFLFFVLYMGWGFSIIAGAVALTMFNIPILVRVIQQALEDVPRSQRDAGLAMGLTRWETTIHVLLPAAMPAIVTGVVLSRRARGTCSARPRPLRCISGRSTARASCPTWRPSPTAPRRCSWCASWRSTSWHA